MGILTRARNAWNVFRNKRDPTKEEYYESYDGYDSYDSAPGYSYRPDRVRFSSGNEKTIVTAILNKIATDVASLTIRHVQLDEEGRCESFVDSGLDRCLNLEANIDQTGQALIHDIVASMLDEGVVAAVPIIADRDPEKGSYDVLSMRTGKIIEWRPTKIKVKLYNEEIGRQQEVWVKKANVAILENPFYAVMNESNSTMKRLIRKLSILDAIDEQSGSGKLDLIIQVPYTIRSDTRRSQSEKRKKDIEMQLTDSKYGIAYIDGTEKITQLNRPVENNLLKQIEYLTNMVYSQIGISQAVLDGTADETTMMNYETGTLERIVSTVVNEFKRKFITPTARTQGKTIMYFRDPFKLVPVSSIAEIADKLTRNEILTSNEIRQKIGFMPSKDPKADKLINSNLNQPEEDTKTEPKIQNDKKEVENE